MKHPVFQFLLETAILLAPGCVRETGTPPDEVRYATVSLNLSQEGDEPGTRSLIPLSAENFRNAACSPSGATAASSPTGIRTVRKPWPSK